MSGISQPTYYWDSCVYLAWIKKETSQGKPHIDAMAQISSDNFQQKNIMFTSVITTIEVLESKLTPEQAEQFKKTFKSSNHTLYDVDPPISNKARQFRQRVLAETSKVLSVPDAIHLATAVIYGAHEFHTFDDGQKGQKKKHIGLLELNGRDWVDKLKICKPVIPQTELGLATPAPNIPQPRKLDQQQQLAIKPPLLDGEKQIHAELLQLAGGMGCPTDFAKVTLTDHQRVGMQKLKEKGYVTVTKKWFMVILPAD